MPVEQNYFKRTTNRHSNEHRYKYELDVVELAKIKDQSAYKNKGSNNGHKIYRLLSLMRGIYSVFIHFADYK
jgi:hypothetical protein